jgi:hypothetical protein
LVDYIFCIIDYHICRDIFDRIDIMYCTLSYVFRCVLRLQDSCTLYINQHILPQFYYSDTGPSFHPAISISLYFKIDKHGHAHSSYIGKLTIVSTSHSHTPASYVHVTAAALQNNHGHHLLNLLVCRRN